MRVSSLILLAAFAPSLCWAQPVSFNRDIRPILSENCFACHGPDAGQRKAGLRLDVRASVTAENDGRAAVVPGAPEASLLMERITTSDARRRMPPADSHKEVDSAEVGLLRRWIAQGAAYEAPWAMTAPMRREAPTATDTSWAHNDIDRWLIARLDREGLGPAPDADPVTLARRLTFDLTGLPPTPEEVGAFTNDRRADAYERLVDRLLAKESFGERMAMHWLDLVRYADTVGYHGDQGHPIAAYRDWVIDAFNGNMRFNRFTIEQLAGDLLDDPSSHQLVATGYNRLLQTTHEGGAQAKEYLTIYAADRVRNLGSVWMGATTGCAQCHDHKYDPYTTRDFYRLAAFFADIEEKGDFAGSPNAVITTRPPELVVDPETKRRTMITRARKVPREVRVLPRGDWLDTSGEVVSPQVPSCYEPLSNNGDRLTRLDLARWLVSGEHPQTARVFVNRLWYLMFGVGISRHLDDLGAQGEAPVHPELLDQLAIAFVDSGWDVKRVVKMIVMSRAYRQTSRLDGDLRARDPDNRLYARQGSWRFQAEMIRDNALAASGILVREVGGDSVRPYQPKGLYRHLNFPPRAYKEHVDERQWRRGVYVHWQRMFLHPMLRAFDAPTREECCAERPVSNTPRAALTLLNDPTFVEAARCLATRALREAQSDADRLRRMFALATSRPKLQQAEAATLKGLLRRHRAVYASDRDAARALVSVGLRPVPGDLDVTELAAWTSVARVILNLDEAITRR